MYAAQTHAGNATRASVHSRRPRRLKSARPARVAAAPQTWQQNAIVTYQRAQQTDLAALRRELADRVAELTNQYVPAGSIYANPATRVATANVQGVVFRMRHQALMIVRPCEYCGVGHFESPAITSLHDLGHALAGWEPRCDHCALADPDGWLTSED